MYTETTNSTTDNTTSNHMHNMQSNGAGLNGRDTERDLLILTGNDPEDKDRKRIRVACDNCRKKKIKCNGSYPCQNCSNSKDNQKCHYKQRPIKKKVSNVARELNGKKAVIHEPTKNGDIINSNPNIDLNQRLTNLESTIHKLTKTIEILVHQNKIQSTAEIEPLTRVDLPIETDTENEEDMDEDKKLTTELHTNPSFDEYIGVHSIMCIFSKDSLDWMECALGDSGSKYITPIRNIPLMYYSILKNYLMKWIDPPVVDKYDRKKLLESPFSMDSKLVLDLVDIYYKEITMVNVLVDSSYVRSLFVAYYNNLLEPNLSKRRKFKLSELLTMTCVLLIALNAKLDKVSNNSKEETSYVKSLQDLQNSLLNNAIFYYHRLSVISDGIETLEGMLLFIIYNECNWISSHINYIPISVVIRYAQELGLHRAESYQNISMTEQLRKRRIWWFCYYFDTEKCFKSGKPPILNINDVTTNCDDDMIQFCKLTLGEANLSNSNISCAKFINEDMINNPQKPISILLLESISSHETDFTLYYHVFALSLTKIRSKSYHSLFTANAQTSNMDSLSTTLEQLNFEMFELATYSKEEYRPIFYNDPNFKFIDREMSLTKRDCTLCAQLSYFTHLMLMNRFPFMVRTGKVEFDERILKFRNISLDSARTILYLIKQLTRENTTSTCYNWVMFYPTSAFFVLAAAILNHPNFSDTLNDINLLIETSMNFFSPYKNMQEVLDTNSIFPEEFNLEIVIRLILNIVIRFYELKVDAKQFENNIELQNHLGETEKLIPEIFKSTGEFKSKIMTFFGASPFSAANSEVDKDSPSSSRLNPSLSNLLDDNEAILKNRQNTSFAATPQYMKTPTCQGNSPSMNVDFVNFFSDVLNNDNTSNAMFNQVNNLPNFFFDNNLGV